MASGALWGGGRTRSGDCNGRTWDYLEYPGRDVLKAKFREDCPLQSPRLTFTGDMGFFTVKSAGWRDRG